MDSMDSNQLLQAQLEEMGVDQDRQRGELLAGIEQRETKLEQLGATLAAQREQILALEQQQGELQRQLQEHSRRTVTIAELLTDLAGKTQQALDLTQNTIH